MRWNVVMQYFKKLRFMTEFYSIYKKVEYLCPFTSTQTTFKRKCNFVRLIPDVLLKRNQTRSKDESLLRCCVLYPRRSWPMFHVSNVLTALVSLMTETVNASQTSVNLHETAWRCIPEDFRLQTRHCMNRKYEKFTIIISESSYCSLRPCLLTRFCTQEGNKIVVLTGLA
jgi:hypothetical protein